MKIMGNKKPGKKTYVLVFMTVIGLLAITLARLANQPATATVTRQTVTLPKPADPSATLKHYAGKFVSFDYPGDLHISSHYITSNLESALFVSAIGGTKHLALRV